MPGRKHLEILGVLYSRAASALRSSARTRSLPQGEAGVSRQAAPACRHREGIPNGDVRDGRPVPIRVFSGPPRRPPFPLRSFPIGSGGPFSVVSMVDPRRWCSAAGTPPTIPASTSFSIRSFDLLKLSVLRAQPACHAETGVGGSRIHVSSSKEIRSDLPLFRLQPLFNCSLSVFRPGEPGGHGFPP